VIDENVLIDRRIRRDRRDDSTMWLVTVSFRSILSRVHDSCDCCEPVPPPSSSLA
jgi:hypothetical protein